VICVGGVAALAAHEIPHDAAIGPAPDEDIVEKYQERTPSHVNWNSTKGMRRSAIKNSD
jgi:hypothetical protein